MRLSYFSTSPLESVRPLTALVRAGGLDYALDRTYEVGQERELRPWPLDLILGLDGSATRFLELLVWAPGYDWARTTMGLPCARTGSHVTGRDAVAIAEEAVRKRADDIRAVERISTRLGSVHGDTTDKAAKRSAADLARLVRDVRVVPSDLLGPAAELMMAYESDDLIALAAVELMHRTQEQGPILRPCGHCGKLFAPLERTDEEYCRRAAPGEPNAGRQCRQIGPQRRYAATVDDLTSAYRREYKRLDKRQRRGGFSRETLDAWRDAARSLLAEAKRDGWEVNRYEQELRSREPEERA